MLASKNLFQHGYSVVVLTHRSTVQTRDHESKVQNSLLKYLLMGFFKISLVYSDDPELSCSAEHFPEFTRLFS